MLQSSFTWLLAGSSSSQAMGLRVLVPHWLVTRSLPQFLAHSLGLSLGSLLHSSWLPSEQANGARAGTQDGSYILFVT